jgi:hypothetical protein
MKTLSFFDALRLLVDEAPANFPTFRGRNRRPEEVVITDFDGTVAVEGMFDACISLLDYDVPRAQLRVYRGKSEPAAAEAFATYAEYFLTFSGQDGERSESVQRFAGTPDEYPDLVQVPASATRWIESTWPTVHGGSMSVEWSTKLGPADEPLSHYVFVEVPGRTLECLDGTPETSPWRILLGHDRPERA